jgi:hypothetical protein
MTFPINSSERNGLIPVLAMLLQFSSKEMMEIQKSVREPIFGNRPAKEVKRIDFANRQTQTTSSSHGYPSSSASVRSIQQPSSASSSYLPPSGSSSQRANNVSSNTTSLLHSTTSSQNNTPKPISSAASPVAVINTGLQIKPVNHEYFLSNENSSKEEFPASMSFDLISPIYSSKLGSTTVAPQRPVNIPPSFPSNTSSMVGSPEEATAASDLPLTERKDSEVSENDFELRQKLKSITSDILDLSMSAEGDVDRTLRPGNLSSVLQGIHTIPIDYTSTDDENMITTDSSGLPVISPPGFFVSRPDGGVGLRATLSGTSIDEITSKAL